MIITNTKILIVDDDVRLLNLLRSIFELKFNELSVLEATNATDALEFLDTDVDKEIACVLTDDDITSDVNEFNGVPLARKIRAKFGKSIKIFMMPANYVHLTHMYPASLFDNMFPKPVDFDKLFEAIESGFQITGNDTSNDEISRLISENKYLFRRADLSLGKEDND